MNSVEHFIGLARHPITRVVKLFTGHVTHELISLLARSNAAIRCGGEFADCAVGQFLVGAGVMASSDFMRGKPTGTIQYRNQLDYSPVSWLDAGEG